MQGNKKTRVCRANRHTLVFIIDDACEVLLTVILVRNGQLLTALGAARSQHATTILCSHALTETMLVHAATIVGLKCSFHLL